MVSPESVEQQLKNIKFNGKAWGKAEIRELPNILIPEEEIYDCVNGVYDGGFALLVATNIRLLLIDKKPLNYLTVEDLRFDMINELDYSHRLIGARISISAGSKNLKFMSFNQQRLRKTIGHVQHCMAEAKKKASDHQEDQKQHLEQINQQLQAYLLAQHQQQEKLQKQLQRMRDKNSGKGAKDAEIEIEDEPVKPSPELSDFLLAQSLLQQHDETKQPDDSGEAEGLSQAIAEPEIVAELPVQSSVSEERLPKLEPSPTSELEDLRQEGIKEIYGKRQQDAPKTDNPNPPKRTLRLPSIPSVSFEIHPLEVAISKLPLALRNKKFGRPSFHAHSRAKEPTPEISVWSRAADAR